MHFHAFGKVGKVFGAHLRVQSIKLVLEALSFDLAESLLHYVVGVTRSVHDSLLHHHGIVFGHGSQERQQSLGAGAIVKGHSLLPVDLQLNTRELRRFHDN